MHKHNPPGTPLELVQPEALRYKAFEPLLLLGKARWGFLDIRLRVKGGGHVSQVYAIRQAIAKAIVTYYQKNVDEQTKQEVRQRVLLQPVWKQQAEGPNAEQLPIDLKRWQHML